MLESIEEDGTVEHNNAIKLRQENAKLELRLVAYQKIAEGGSESIAQLNDKIRQLEVANERWQSRFQTFENVEKQVITNDYAKCVEQRDEFKHQLNAANKEIEILNTEQKAILKANKDLKDQVKKLKDDIINYVVEKNDELSEANETIKTLKNLPTQGFEDYDSNDFIQKDKNREPQKHPMYPIHWGGWDKEIEDFAKAEVENKDPFVTNQYQDDMLYKDAYSGSTQDFFNNTFPSVPEPLPNEAQEEPVYTCNKCGYKVAHNTNYYGGCGFCKEGKMECSTTAENLEEKFDKGEDCLDYFKPYNCPCNKCKETKTEKSWEEAASDLALRVIKLEKQVEELSLIKKSRKAIRL